MSLKTINKFSFKRNLIDDRFDLNVRIHQFYGISYVKFEKFKFFLFLFYQISISVTVIVLTNFLIYKVIFESDNSFNITGNISIFISFTMNYIYAIASLIIFSFKSGKINEFITKLRSLISELNANQQIINSKLKSLRLTVYLFYGVLIFIIFFDFFTITYPKKLYWGFMNNAYLYGLVFLTDFYLIYFTKYIVIIQKSYNDNLSLIHEKNLTLNEVKAIKKYLIAIQSLIKDLTDILSPNLLITSALIAYNLTNCCYILYCFMKFGDISIETLIKIFPAFVSFLITFVRLVFICICAEKINNHVINNIFYQKF
jgi:hypothetical protein